MAASTRESPNRPEEGFHAAKVVVIVGASSGIGRLAAIEFAREGSRVVAAARNRRALETLEAEVGGLPGSVLPVVADVADEAQVAAIAEAAVAAYGRIDTWINVAAVMLYAKVADTTPEELRRILDVNVVGVHNGYRAAVPVMLRHGGGTIITIGSVESIRAFPLQAAYAASKHAVKALTESLRVELEHEDVPIRVVLVEPSYINTPLFDHARSKIGSRPEPIPPLYQPDVVVDALLHLAEHPVDEVVVGGVGKGMTILERLNPRLMDAALTAGGIAFTAQQSDEPPRPDNLFSPLDDDGATHGRWGQQSFGSSLYTQTLGLHSGASRIGLVAMAALVGMLVLRRR
jgi:NAD(P)-dependent dehydrogenase (short-subunit alcohol dehydrogenase family)